MTEICTSMVKEGAEELIEETGDVIKEANISLIIERYEDIFSSFDPRDYNERALSDDFLIECKRAARDKKGGIELRLLVPKALRNFRDELKIKKRLLHHFKHHHELEDQKIKKIIKEGVLWFGIGTVFILTTSWLHAKDTLNFGLTVLRTMLEPAGWFSFWEGLGKVFIVSKEHAGNYIFYKKMSKVEINFLEY